MKKRIKKLLLNRETILNLQSEDFGRAAGGTADPTGYDQIAATDCACAQNTEFTYCPAGPRTAAINGCSFGCT